ncbi:hypothetical protein Tco_1437854 [Tanacetum coccineum]
MGELTFFLGLQVQQKKDGIFISQDKYVVEILKKFGFTEVKTASTPMETQKPLLKDKDGEEVDVHMYRSMIGSLMYLTSSRPDIMFAVCACARYQVNPKVSHLHAMKRIFRSVKKQLVVANSTTEAEYVAASSWLQVAVDNPKTTTWNEFSITIASAIICLATNQKFNFSKFIFEGMIRNLDNVSGKFLVYPRLKLNELMELCATLQKNVLDLEKTKTTQANNIASLKRRVKKLEKKRSSRAHKLKRLYKVGFSARVESSGDEEDLGEDVSHPTKAETRGVTSWISSQHNGVNNRESLNA